MFRLLLPLLAACDLKAELDDSGPTDTGEPLTCQTVYQLEGEGQTVGTSPSGLEYCAADDLNAGRFDRVEAEACATDWGIFACDPTQSDSNACTADSDCEAGWACLQGDWDMDYACECVHTCTSDADCAADEACLCAAGVETGGGSFLYGGFRRECQPADCRSGDDCGGEACSVGKDVCNWGVEGLHCRTAADTCRVDSDCPQGNQHCGWDDASAAWTCQGTAICE